jgi:energy-coupling factor transporter transmembrane protein EcfT
VLDSLSIYVGGSFLFALHIRFLKSLPSSVFPLRIRRHKDSRQKSVSMLIRGFALRFVSNPTGLGSYIVVSLVLVRKQS